MSGWSVTLKETRETLRGVSDSCTTEPQQTISLLLHANNSPDVARKGGDSVAL